MDHFLYSHYNRVSDQASYKNSCFLGGWGFIGLFPLFVFGSFNFMIIFTIPIMIRFTIIIYHSYTFLEYC